MNQTNEKKVYETLLNSVKFSLWFFNKLQKIRTEIFIEQVLEIPVNSEIFERFIYVINQDFKSDKVLFFSASEEITQKKIIYNTLKKL